MSASPYFKFYSSDFLTGILGMEPDEIAVYTVIIVMIYDRGEPITADMDALAWRLRMSAKRFKNVVDRLIAQGKLTLADGRFGNARAEKEMQKRKILSDKQAENANARWSSGEEKPLQNNGPPMPPHPVGIPVGNAEPMPTRSQKPEAKEDRNLTVSCPKPAAPGLRTRASYPDDFEEFWRAYPTDANMSKAEAGKQWARLNADDRRAAIAATQGFREHCRANPDYRPLHAMRFLSQRRFDGFAAKAASAPTQVFVEEGSPGWRAWIAQRGKTPPTVTNEGKTGWYFPSEFPAQQARGAA